MKLNLVFVLILTLTINSCAKQTKCKTGGLNFAITNLDSELDDTVMIYKFVKHSNFQLLSDSREYVYVDSLDEMNSIFGDTLFCKGHEVKWHDEDKNNTGFISADFDYEIVSKNFTYRITEMTLTPKYKKCGGLFSLECPDCYSPVTYFKINDIPQKIGENDVFYIEN